MKQDVRTPFDAALARARVSAYPTGQFVGQESFMSAGEILDLARRAGIGPGVTVLDLCCGVAGPGRLVTRELGCDYLGVDYSETAVRLARERAEGLPCRFEVQQVPPVPPGPVDVVLLLETLLAFPDKDTLVAGVAAALLPGGRFAFTIEEGQPLTAAEQQEMPDADTVWLMPLADLHACLERAGLQVQWEEEHTAAHAVTAEALVRAFGDDEQSIVAQVGRQAFDELVAAHRLWVDWLRSGRVRKFAVVAGKPAA